MYACMYEYKLTSSNSTTTELTTSIARGISHLFFSGSTADTVVEYIVRAVCIYHHHQTIRFLYLVSLTSNYSIQTFFALNLLSNFIMWALFTRALTASPSTTKVAITNTTANFLVTAVLGMVVFRELVGGLWWLGAVLMASGCILVGMREEGKVDEAGAGSGTGNGNGNSTGAGVNEEGIRLTSDLESSDDEEVEGSRRDEDLLSFREN